MNIPRTVFLPTFLILLCLGAQLSAAHAADASPELVTLQKINPDGDLTLSDGRALHLRGIHVVKLADENVSDKNLQLLNPTTDRYGRIDADAVLPDKTYLQDHLLDDGLAFVVPVTGKEPRLTQMLQHETAARTAQRGVWANNSTDNAYADVSGDDAYDKVGSFAFVRFKVLEASRVKNMVYLNAGPDHRKDFTVAIRSGDLRAFKNANIDPLTYQGKTIRVRGWIIKRGGALVNVTSPAQIEVLSDGSDVRQ